MTRRVLKFATGEPIPDGATYLSTIAQTQIEMTVFDETRFVSCWLVWHYYEIEEDDEAQE